MILYSLIFGLLAWALAGAAIAVKRGRGEGALVLGSFFCAAVSAVWQFFEIQKRAYAGDFAGIEDTIRAVILGIVVMFTVTLVLNGFALAGKKRNDEKTA